jgi:hypothetical protein
MFNILIGLCCVCVVFFLIKHFPKMVAVSLVGATVLSILVVLAAVYFGKHPLTGKGYTAEDLERQHQEIVTRLNSGIQVEGALIKKSKSQEEEELKQWRLAHPEPKMVWKGDHYERADEPTSTPPPAATPVPNFEHKSAPPKTLYVER